MPGLLDMFDSSDPQTQGLLAAAAGMLNASGPSLMPHSFGQVAAAGIGGYQAGKQQALAQQQEQLKMAMLQQQVAQATRKNDLINNFLAANMGGGQPAGTGTTSAAGVTVPQSLPMGSTDADGRTISTPGFFAPADYAQQPAQPAGGSAPGFGGVPSAAIAADLAFKNGENIGGWINDRNKPVDAVKTAQQLGIPLSMVRDSQIADLQSKGITSVRPGGTLYQNGRPIFSAPTTEGQFTTWDNGQPTSTLVPGAADVNQTLAYSNAAGKARMKPMTAYNAQGKPVFTNEYVASNGGIDPDPPTWTGGPLDNGKLAQIQAAAQAGDKDAAAFLASLQQGQAGPLTPSLAPGVAESQTALANAGAKRYTDLISQASDSPTRVNVYDNILNLSKAGVQTGPGAAWQSQFKGIVANAPFLSSVAGKWKDDVSGLQELNKFMYQNAQRNWQAAGGTGTDSQLDAYSKANPNDSMFPQALQKMAQWGKAGELALQGKVNAMQQWKDNNGGNVANQDQFERMWRNNFDPVLYQLRTMDPQDAANYVANLKKTNPNAYGALMMKAQALKNIGGL